MVEHDIDYDMAVLNTFIIFTPITLLVSWGLEVVIDTPAKNFAHALDLNSRYEPQKKKDGSTEDDRTTWKLI